MSLRIKLGNFLFKNAYGLYKPMYFVFKEIQDKYEIEVMTKHIQPGQVVLDIGANIGFYTLKLAALCGNTGKVHCFEPDTVNFERLKNNCGHLANVILNRNAVGPKDEILKMYTSKTLNVDHRTYQFDDYDKVMDIEAISIDSYLGENKKVNFIKMDIQGFEMSAIYGMEETLDANKDIKISSELWPYGLKQVGSSAMEYFTYLTQKEFSCYIFDNNKMELLSANKIARLQNLDEQYYFNIFATRSKLV